MNKISTRKIVITGVMSAIAIFLGATRLGFIPWVTGTSITIMTVPVIIGSVLEGPIVGLVTGFIFGIFSLIQAAIAPAGPGDVIFTNPLISVFPRLFIGPVAWVVYIAIKAISRTIVQKFKDEKGNPDNNAPAVGEILALIVSGVAGSVTNTALVLGMIGILGLAPWALIGSIALANGIPEAVAAAIITLAVVGAWKLITYGRKGSKLE